MYSVNVVWAGKIPTKNGKQKDNEIKNDNVFNKITTKPPQISIYYSDWIK